MNFAVPAEDRRRERCSVQCSGPPQTNFQMTAILPCLSECLIVAVRRHPVIVESEPKEPKPTKFYLGDNHSPQALGIMLRRPWATAPVQPAPSQPRPRPPLSADARKQFEARHEHRVLRDWMDIAQCFSVSSFRFIQSFEAPRGAGLKAKVGLLRLEEVGNQPESTESVGSVVLGLSESSRYTKWFRA